MGLKMIVGYVLFISPQEIKGVIKCLCMSDNVLKTQYVMSQIQSVVK